MKYILRDTVTELLHVMTLPEILYEINRDRSDTWENYDHVDWVDGLREFTSLEEVK